ncbi:hypothetical protein [Pedobacter sp. MC2016-24]|uniref:hypothetical protein n=1 Tax=Pedobacter sp. MC2016-24 TaxID=2780090 RepID=UPI00187E94D5|nr:hypothetical protein [Pedobacter sp. MC2016-24]MBE9601921.1 hypothetical protein [Pedobacter sp. MC2016-24]
MEKINAVKEFTDQIKAYLMHYKMQEADLGKLILTGITDIKNIFKFNRVIGFKKAEQIANVFGLRYFEFGNPDFAFPDFDKLPAETQQVLLDRKEKGYEPMQENLTVHVNSVLSSGILQDEFTSEDVLQAFPDEVRAKTQANRITHLFKTGKLKARVESTGKTRKKDGLRGTGQIIFRLK